MSTPFLDILREKVVVFDGAMGTNLQSQNLSPDDFGGEKYQGCNEFLVHTKPSAVESVHAAFLQVGCDVVETNSFGSTAIVLAEYDLADRAYQLNFDAAQLARRVASDFSTPAHPRFVAGSMGPTTKLPSLGHISFKDMEVAYSVQAEGLVEGGVDLLVVETCQDLLQAKAALSGIFSYFTDARRRVPVVVSVTVETMGTMLLGTEIAAALTALEPFDIDAIGMNCATGPKEMSENVRYLCSASSKPVFVMPNAGIPENIGGRAHYGLSPDEFAYYLSHFVRDVGVGIVGGCCGTTPEHLRRLVESVGGLAPAPRKHEFVPSCSSTYTSVPFHIDPPPIMVGERTNANGSKLFRELLAREDWEGIVAIARDQVKEGAHLLDVCAAYVGRDEARDMREIISRFSTQVTVPLMIDSTEAPVIEEALQRIGGRAIVNSINLEDGEERMGSVLASCKRFGAAVVALTIDETGMAKTAERKVAVARRIHQLATEKYRMRDEDLIFDTLTFTLGSGDEEFRRAGVETIEAIRRIKKEFPKSHTLLGVSNISFGLAPHARQVLNSVFLHYAVESGLDMAIVNASKILPLYRIPDEEHELCRKLIFDERTASFDPLQAFIAHFAAKAGPVAERKSQRANSVEERLKNRIIEGDKLGLREDLDIARERYTPLDIINNILLDGMRVVGDLFGSGQMQLPFVLQSAEVMKSAVGYLEQFMEKTDATTKGSIVLATVKGDVHDIGKNLVDIILTNNGYKVYNLGIKCPIETMLRAAEEYRADAIGMSGLLVKSTVVMKENLEVMNERRIRMPVVLGGAALTRRYVEEELRSIYRGTVEYANDAFDGLRFMENILERRRETGRTRSVAAKQRTLREMEAVYRDIVSALARIPDTLFEQPSTIGEWSVHDLVAHLSGWEKLTAERLRMFIDGKRNEIRWFDEGEADTMNKQLVEARRTVSRTALMREWKENHGSLLTLVSQLEEADLSSLAGGGTVLELIAENTYAHERHHLQAIRAVLARASQSEGDDGGDTLSGIEAKIAVSERERTAVPTGSVTPVTTIPRPPFYGTKVVTEINLDEVFGYINEAALFRGQWQMRRGKMSQDSYDRLLREKVYPEYERLKAQAKAERLLEPKVVYGYFPCQSQGNDLIIYRLAGNGSPFEQWSVDPLDRESTLAEWIRFTFPRQTKGQRLCIADFFASVDSGRLDVVAFHLVTMGSGASVYARKLFEADDYRNYLYFHGLSVESTEALAELWHRRIRIELGIDGSDARLPGSTEIDVKRLFSQGYQGSRYSFGYPACPRLEDHVKLFELLRPERIGVELTEEYQLVPEQTTDAIIVHHPGARYFGLS